MKIVIHPAFILYLILVGLIDSISVSISLLLTLAIHETGHILAGRMCGECYDKIVLTPLGGMISYKSGSASCKGIKGMLIAAAGPAANIAAVFLFLHLPAIKEMISHDAGTSFILMNASMMLMNLMPVLPLDGGRIVFSAGYYLFPVSALTAVLTVSGRIWGCICTMMSLFSAVWWGKMNISLLAAGVYIFICAGRQREAIYAGNLHTVIQERFARSEKTVSCQLISVQDDACLSCIIPFLLRAEHLVCIVEAEKGGDLIEERRLLNALMASPSMTFAQAFSEPALSGDKFL